MNFPLEALPCAINQHDFLLKTPSFQEATKERPTGERKGYFSYFRAWVSTREVDFPREMLCLKGKTTTTKQQKNPPTHSESQPLDMKLFCFRPVMLSFSFCFAVLESPSDQTASSSTHTYIPFCSVCLPLCSTGIKNYFAEREECQ